MSNVFVVIEHPEAGRSLSSVDALPAWEGRGWTALGPCSDRNRDPIRTDAEWRADAAAEAERIAALLKSDDAPAPSRPRK